MALLPEPEEAKRPTITYADGTTVEVPKGTPFHRVVVEREMGKPFRVCANFLEGMLRGAWLALGKPDGKKFDQWLRTVDTYVFGEGAEDNTAAVLEVAVRYTDGEEKLVPRVLPYMLVEVERRYKQPFYDILQTMEGELYAYFIALGRPVVPFEEWLNRLEAYGVVEEVDEDETTLDPTQEDGGEAAST